MMMNNSVEVDVDRFEWVIF